MTPTRTHVLIEKALGEPLVEFCRAMRADERSWSYIARAVQERTGAQINKESLRRWFGAATETSSERAA